MNESDTLKELLEIMHEHDLDAIKVKVGEQIYELVRREAGTPMMLPAMPGPSAASAHAPMAGAQGAPGPVASSTAKKVTAPLVGVFYRSSSPDSEPFVKEGDRVEVGQVLCILEAMKLFNEITSDYAGTVTRIIPENGELVTLGQELFWIEP
jgi:acetyl-CoA carboxylase biotin carboxyl carrier protein